MLSDSMQPVKSGARFVRTLGLPYAPAAKAGGFGAALARTGTRATRAGGADGSVTAVRQCHNCPPNA